MKWPAVLLTLVLVVSCGQGQLAYQDRVTPLSVNRAHPLYAQLLPLVVQKTPGDIDALMRTWKEFLGETSTPLREESAYTFVYYDFSHTLTQVFLEASFAPGRKEPLTRVENTFLFVRVYSIPAPAQASYRFASDTVPLVDPFHSSLKEGDDLWQPLENPMDAATSVHWVAGASEGELEGQDLIVLLPPSYQRNLGLTYPLVVIAGLEGRSWTNPLAQMMADESIRPFVAVAIGPVASPKKVLEDRVVPFLRRHYRASALPADLVLVGWGAMTKPAHDLAVARPDFWTKAWMPPADQARTDEAWNSLAPPYFRTLFTVVAP